MIRSTNYGTRLRSVYRTGRYGYPYHWVEAGGPSTEEHGETIVMLHGIMAHAMGYRFVVEDLATDYHVVLADMPAHGRDESFRGVIEPTVDSLADWLVSLVDDIHGGPIHVVGHSLGGLVAYLAARRRPEAFRTVTLMAPGFRIPFVGSTRHVLAWMPARLGLLGMNPVGIRIYEQIQWRQARMDDREREQYLMPLQQPERLEFMLRVAADLLKAGNRIPTLRPLKPPTQVIWGATDHLLPRSDASHVSQNVAADVLHVFEGSGHCPMEDEPTLFVRSMYDFLRGNATS
jgi:pimeloyl-ACP methyl ester carboxylesterase